MLPLELAKALIDFILGMLLGVLVFFHQQADEHFMVSIDAVEVGVSELAPPTFDQGSDLVPTTCEYILHLSHLLSLSISGVGRLKPTAVVTVPGLDTQTIGKPPINP
jgi:hypothetical protein